MSSTSTLSLRLPKETRERLDKAAARSRRSRSFLIQEALERHLDDVEREGPRESGTSRFAILYSLAGAGAALNGPRSKEDIDASVRWRRDDE